MPAEPFFLRAIDWFIPASLRSDIALLWQARIFVVSHLAGPCLGVLIVAYLRGTDPSHPFHIWIIAAGIALFWSLPLLLRQTAHQRLVAVISVADLTFISLYGSFFYGGMSSPFLAWVLVALLLGFFYLSEHKLLLLGIFGTLALGFSLAYVVNGGFPEHIRPTALAGVGALSVCCATAYTSMMAAYYAQVLSLQSRLEQEAQQHLALAVQLRTAKEAAERANQAKSVFIAKMSHQLRTPLNAVIGYSEILLEDEELSNNGQQTANLKRINNAGKHLLSLVTDVLDLSKLDPEGFDIAPQTFDLRSVVEDVTETCRSLVLNNGNQFHTDFGSDLGSMVCDPRRLRQIIFNLLSNAGKFTKRGTVTLSVARERSSADLIRISVRDSGIGIPHDTLHKLFKDFSQVEAATASRFGGTGLGLAVSQNLSRMMGGRIAVESEYGKGSCFTVILPAEPHGRMPSPGDATASPCGTDLAA
jgi:signal transduction histidine kinase